MAVTIHNFPEGMAVGVAIAGALAADFNIAGAMALSLGIAIQNVPEGAIISMPLRAEGNGRWRAFGIGALSGIVEPVGGAGVKGAEGVPCLVQYRSWRSVKREYIYSTPEHSNERMFYICT